MKLFGAAATKRGNRACDAGVSKLQLSKSIPAASAAPASSGDLTWTWTRHRLPLSCCKSKTEYFLSGRSMGKTVSSGCVRFKPGISINSAVEREETTDSHG